MRSKIEVSRRTCEGCKLSGSYHPDVKHCTHCARPFNLAAPVVEHQPVAAWQRKSKNEDDRWFYLPDSDVEEAIRLGYEVRKLYTAPPELAELQAEISRLQALAYIGEHQFDDLTWKSRCTELQATIARLTADFNQLGERYSKLQIDVLSQDATARRVIAERDAYKTEIERLKAGQGEPVAFWYWPKDCPSDKAFTTNQQLPKDFYEVMPLYTSQPAPVSVVLPDREHVHSKTLPFRNPAIGDGYISGWNACLDKVKELNQ